MTDRPGADYAPQRASDPDRIRGAAVPDRRAPSGFDTYLDKVRGRAYTITDEDVQALKDAGHTEDEIFEHTLSAAVAAGLERLDAGLRTLG